MLIPQSLKIVPDMPVTIVLVCPHCGRATANAMASRKIENKTIHDIEMACTEVFPDAIAINCTGCNKSYLTVFARPYVPPTPTPVSTSEGAEGL